MTTGADAAAPTRLFRHGDGESHALVALERRPDGAWVVCVSRGAGRGALREAQRLGPFLEHEAGKARLAVLQGLRAEGFEDAGIGAARRELASADPARRAHAARRLARARDRAAVEPMLQVASNPRVDISTIIEALSCLGDARALPVVLAEAERKLLSRRRAGEEALRRMDDAAGVRSLALRARARLPEAVRAALDRTRDVSPGGTRRLVAALAGLDAAEAGAALEDLYLVGEPTCVDAVRAHVAELDVSRPHLWRHVKSLWKRAMMRVDEATVGVVAWRVEQCGRTAHGATATLRSGFDGELRTMRVFSKKTVDYVLRRTWRWLRELARSEPARYAFAAAAVIAPYRADDRAEEATDGVGASYLLHQVLLGSSPRFFLDARAMRFRRVAQARAPSREEANPALWDQQPLAFVRLLATARHPLAQRFALTALAERHPRLLEQAAFADLLGMTLAADARVVDLALGELRRRFDPSKTELDAVRALSASPIEAARNIGLRWMNETARRWLSTLDETIAFLTLEEPHAREVAVRLVVANLAGAREGERQACAARLLQGLERGDDDTEPPPAFADVLLRALAPELQALCPLPRALALITSESEPALAVGAHVLSRKQGALDLLGAAAALALAEHEKLAVRRAGHALLLGARSDLTRDPTPAISLLASDWADTRAVGRELLAACGPALLTLEVCLAIADAAQPDTFSFARDVIERALPQVDREELLARLAHHPASFMRRLALSIAHSSLRPGVVSLLRIEPLLRAGCWATPPCADEQRQVLALLLDRALADEAQAEVAGTALSELAVMGVTGSIRDQALCLLAQLRLRFPRIESPIAIEVRT